MFQRGDKLRLKHIGAVSQYEITGIFYDYIEDINWYSWCCRWPDGSQFNGVTTKEYTEKHFVRLRSVF